MAHGKDRITGTNEDSKQAETYLNLKLLGRVLTYAIIIMIALGLAFLTGVIIWVLRRVLGV